MKNSVQLTKAINPVKNLLNRPPLRRGFLLIPLALGLACFALAPAARAVDPPPDGGYLNFTTAEGEDALFSLTTGEFNTAIGFHALWNNTTGSANTATGQSALFSNTTGVSNTATGDNVLFNNTGDNNTATGESALSNNTTGSMNTAIGAFTMLSNTSGNRNVTLGFRAGANNTTGDDNINIGNAVSGPASESHTIRVGKQGTHTAAFIAGIAGVPVGGGNSVVVNSAGQLGVPPSSKRFKDGIKSMDKASEAILALQPVTFRYKHELDPKGIPQFGLVAEQVEKVNPDLVTRDADGKVYTVRYEAVNAMLLNEFLKEHRKVEEQGRTEHELEATIAQQQKEIKALTTSLKEQASQIQKVSDKVEMSRPAPQMVGNNQ
jgi:Chaperone of endosialidase